METINTAVEREQQPVPSFEQAGGHSGAFEATHDGRLRKVCPAAEVTFYEKQAPSFDLPPAIRAFIPKFFGSTTVGGKPAIIIENLTHGMKGPSILDAKMGTTGVAPDADNNPGKKQRTIVKDKGTTTQQLGYRICAGKIYRPDTNDYKIYSKEYTNEITVENMQEHLLPFFIGRGGKVRTDVLTYFIDKLSVLQAWYQTQQIFRVYTTSILFVYDAGAEDHVKAEVRLIDFAHCWPINDGGIDDGFLCGINNLLKYFAAIKFEALTSA